MGTRFPYALSLFFSHLRLFCCSLAPAGNPEEGSDFFAEKIGAYKWALSLNFFSLITEEDLEKQLARKKGRQIQEIAA